MCEGLVRYACAPSHMPSASGRRPVTAVRMTTRTQNAAAIVQYSAGREKTMTAALRNLTINRWAVGGGLRGALGAVRHGAYDMRYGRQEAEIAHARPPNDPDDRGRRGSPTGGHDGF